MRSRSNIGHHAFLTSYSVIVLLPFLWLGLASFKTAAEFDTDPAGLPASLGWENFERAWSAVNLAQALMNSAIVCIAGVLGVLLGASLASFGITSGRSAAGKYVFALLVAGLMVPVNAAIIPLFVLVSDLGLINTRIGVILPFVAFNLPLAVLLITNWMGNIPKELFDAARVDGASRLQLFRLIALPLSLPILGTVAILTFVSLWNEFLLTLVLLTGEETRTVPLALSGFKTEFSVDRGAAAAGVIMSMIPTIAFYVLFHRTIASGVSEGGIKG